MPPERPFALAVFFSSGHFPYASRWPYYLRHGTDGYAGPDLFMRRAPDHAGSDDAPTVARVRGLYAGALEATDAALGRTLAALGSAGVLDHTLVVLTADHGETLFEADRGLGHGDHLAGREALMVPLVMAGPGVPAGRVVRGNVRSIDVLPTVLGLLGAHSPSGVDGEDLRPRLAAGWGPDLPVFAETGLWFLSEDPPPLQDMRIHYAGREEMFTADLRQGFVTLRPDIEATAITAKHRAVILGTLKGLYMPTRNGPLWRFYDTAADPDEAHDISGDRPDDARRLREALSLWIRSDPDMEERSGFFVARGGR
jgi:arylsulfatase A-like enzyme